MARSSITIYSCDTCGIELLEPQSGLIVPVDTVVIGGMRNNTGPSLALKGINTCYCWGCFGKKLPKGALAQIRSTPAVAATKPQMTHPLVVKETPLDKMDRSLEDDPVLDEDTTRVLAQAAAEVDAEAAKIRERESEVAQRELARLDRVAAEQRARDEAAQRAEHDYGYLRSGSSSGSGGASGRPLMTEAAPQGVVAGIRKGVSPWSIG